MGISYHANYFIWFETGRIEYLRNLGVDYAACEASGMFLPVVEARARYRMSTTYDDILRLAISVRNLARSQITFDYQIYRDKDLCAEGMTRHAFVGTNKKPMRIPAAIRNAIEKDMLA